MSCAAAGDPADIQHLRSTAWHNATGCQLQGLLKEQLEVVKYKTEAGVLRYTIRPLDVELPFDKVRCWVAPSHKQSTPRKHGSHIAQACALASS